MIKNISTLATTVCCCLPSWAGDLQSELMYLRDNHPMLRATTFAVTASEKRLTAANIHYHLMEYGSYFSQWRKRNALKLWTGWPTFPMVFVEGVLVGGDKDVQALLAAGGLK